jgi:uncharacterized protein YegP (UPF0339 family)
MVALSGPRSSRFPSDIFDSEGRELAGMATATRKAATKVSADPALRVEVYQENSGRHSWHLTSGDGRNLARSCESFASRDDAEREVAQVRLSAGIDA